MTNNLYSEITNTNAVGISILLFDVNRLSAGQIFKTVNSGPNEILHQSVLGTIKSSFQWLKLSRINYDQVTKHIEMDVILKPKSNSQIRGHWDEETVKWMTAALCMRAEFPSWTAPRPVDVIATIADASVAAATATVELRAA